VAVAAGRIHFTIGYFFHGRKRRLWDTGGRGLQKQKFHGEEIVFTGEG